jgi:hypothetical protein
MILKHSRESLGVVMFPKYTAYPSLGKWCNEKRCAYNQIQQGKPTKYNLSQDRIERLEEIGFKWKLALQGKTTFEQRCHDLEAFKREFGHCHVPREFSVNPSLGHWWSKMRCAAYNQKQQGKPTKYNLTKGQKERLEEMVSNGNSMRNLSNAVMILKHSRASLGIAMFPLSTR